MNTLIIRPHSFVDLITNSSSEVFVCDTEKSIETVKMLLEKLLNTYNALNDCSHKSFSNVFGEIYAIERTFIYTEVPGDIREEYENHCRRYREYHRFGEPEKYQLNPKWIEADSKWTELNNSLEQYAYGTEEYNKLSTKISKQYQKVWDKWHDAEWQAELKLFLYFLKINNIDQSKLTVNSTRKDKLTIFGSDLEKEYYQFRFAIDNGTDLHKGAIVIRSADDNSIPYDMFEMIKTAFNARHFHI